MRRQFIAIITKIMNVLEINLKNENEKLLYNNSVIILESLTVASF